MQENRLYLNNMEQAVIDALLYANVRFVVVGGAAVQYHGHLRVRKDLDILSEPSVNNADDIALALKQIGIILSPDNIFRLSKRNLQTPLSGVYSNIEILTSIQGVNFSKAFDEAVLCDSIPVLSKHHLIASKSQRSEPGDLDDIKALEKV